MTREARLTDTFVELADTLVAEFDVTDFLTVLSTRAVELVRVESAGVLLVGSDDSLRLMASSSDEARVLELFELQNDSGPCVECFRTGEAVVNESVAGAEDRWPGFGVAAIKMGYTAVHALPLRYRHQVIGAMNLFSTREDPLSAGDLALARALADIATISVLQQRDTAASNELTAQLNTALQSRVIIEQAKGALAEAAGLDMQEAFDAIRSYSRRNNRRLAEVAVSLIERSLTAADVLAPITDRTDGTR